MSRGGAWKRAAVGGLLLGVTGCTSPLPAYLGIRRPFAPPELPPPAAVAAALPAAPPTPEPPADNPPAKDGAAADDSPSFEPGSLQLGDVLASVDQHFPLLLAVEQERIITGGNRLSAEGAFDAQVRFRESLQTGSFESHRLDFAIEQPTPYNGLNLIGGYRFGFGDFPVYYGDRKTANLGEFRGGLSLPLLRDAGIDRRRATLRQAQILENLADPIIRRARLDFLRAGARAYWSWIAAGEQHRVTDDLLRIARDRQEGLEKQVRSGQLREFVAIDNSRLIVEREGALIAALRRWQQAGYELSLYLRDPNGEPFVPDASALPKNFTSIQVPPPPQGDLNAPVQTAYAQRPELARFALLKERAAVELRLAENQQLPAVNLSLVGSRDAGQSKTGTGVNAPDERVFEGAVTVELPVQRRDARGRELSARGLLGQLLAQERFARDQIALEVQDAISNLVQTHQRLDRARAEQRISERVADLERERFVAGEGTLLEVNLRELAAAAAQAKVIDTLADYYRALADFAAALGADATP